MQRLKKAVDMTEGPFLKKMIMFAIPLVLILLTYLALLTGGWYLVKYLAEFFAEKWACSASVAK